MILPLTFWLAFLLIIFILVLLDLGIANKNKVPTFKAASYMTFLWFTLACLFAFLIYKFIGEQESVLFITGYLVELALSVDNIFVFILIFNYFNIEPKYQHKVLLVGIFTAVILRLLMITFGIYLLSNFVWIFYIFGMFLIYSSVQIIIQDDKKPASPESKSLKMIKKYFRISNKPYGERFFVRENGKLFLTPLFLVLFLIEQADLIFALDSIPAILAITNDLFIVFTSNIFAILGLRSMYFVLSNIMHKFSYIKYALSIILAYIGCKMILSVHEIHIPTILSLIIIILSITGAVLLSMRKNKYSKK